MIYELGFLGEAWDEWGKLDKAIREQLKKKLTERLQHPHVPAAKLSGCNNRYKIIGLTQNRPSGVQAPRRTQCTVFGALPCWDTFA